MVAMITVRSLHKDIARYNQESADEAQEEFGWKLVHGDVFRPPGSAIGVSQNIFYLSTLKINYF